MQFTKTFAISKERVDRIRGFFSTHGYRLEATVPNYYRFKRGSGWARLSTSDVRKLPTTVAVSLLEGEGDVIQVVVSYDISTIGGIATSGDREKIMAEIEGLEAFTKVK